MFSKVTIQDVDTETKLDSQYPSIKDFRSNVKMLSYIQNGSVLKQSQGKP